MARPPPGRDRGSAAGWDSTYRDLIDRPRGSLGGDDLEQLAVAAYLIGEDEHSSEAWEAAHRLHLDEGNPAEAARCSFWLAFGFMMRGMMAQAGGWLSRTEAVIGDDLLCSARGFVLIPALVGALESGDPSSARDLAARASAIADEVHDPDLAAFACLGEGQALVAGGDTAEGTARFDEAMLMVSTGEVGPITSGVVYCAVVLECVQIYDVRRAAEWTQALHTWCEEQPEMVPYRGQCLVHRSQILQAAGDWPDALESSEEACRRLSDPPHPAIGLARYQEAELHRLRGGFDRAETAYREASANGQDPMPGLALLAKARDQLDEATAAIRRALQETTDRMRRPPLLAAAVEILREAGDLAGARAAAEELAEISADSGSEALRAMASTEIGSVMLGEGDPAGASSVLRAARSAWADLGMPYEAARTSVMLGLVCISLSDRPSAQLELQNAGATFERLGAHPDLDRLRSICASAGLASDSGSGRGADDSGLSARELEVLAHVARGETNREIAAALTISQHTVGRHLENVFAKLGVSGRAAATAYAYEHELL
jgi:DNA-binding CsgD family transcriptional regulator